ncbi:MAG TPA: hypothetical protein VJV79_01245 [Polyangiaceae bacterium]|nr:hypothetical protein [Polyangiaceae bacterium]
MKTIIRDSILLKGRLGSTILAVALAGAALGCAVEANDEPSKTAELKLSASYDAGYGFAFDAQSTARLAELLEPGEALKVVFDGQSRDLGSTPWADVLARGGGPVRLEAVAGARVRALGELEVAAQGTPQCESAPEAEASELTERSVSAQQSQALAAGCSHMSYSWYCINCQCRSGIYALGYSRRYICIYGELYPQNVYRCNCSFTPQICGVET